MRALKLIFLVFISFNSFAQKKDVIVEISDLKEQVKKLQMENEKLSTELIQSNSKNENRILDLGVKLENLQFEFNVLKRLVEQYRTGENISNSTPLGNKSSYPDEGVNEKSDAKAPSYSQCSATTKKGTRCSRSARSNGLCWQHGG
jgi:hypothetical protein